MPASALHAIPVSPFWLVVFSAVVLGFYDIFKKHAVRENAAMVALLFSTIFGALFFIIATMLSGHLCDFASIKTEWAYLIGIKSLIVGLSWACVYQAMSDLPISLAAPVRSTAPLWTVIGGIILYGERPSAVRAMGMILIFAGYYFLSVVGRGEGFSFKHKSMIFIVLGTILGSVSALYDKYLLNVVEIPAGTVQLYFSIGLVFVSAFILLVRRIIFKTFTKFKWRWSIPVTGILLIIADMAYFHALNNPGVSISYISLLRRSSCVIAFFCGAYYFHDLNIRWKSIALALVIAGVVISAFG